MKKLTVVVTITAVLSTACLSTNVSLDVRNPERIELAIDYEMPRSMWELGVFDQDSPERPIPVSLRDARETAGLYDDVELVDHSIDAGDERVSVTTRYRIGSVESLASIWGRIEGRVLEFDPAGGELSIPLARGLAAADEEQRTLIADAFRGEQFSIRIRGSHPMEIIVADIEGARLESDRRGRDLTWSVPMATLLLSREDVILRARRE